MRQISIIRLFLIICILPLKAQTDYSELYQHGSVSTELITMPYRLMKPANYDPDKQYPLIVFLHGSGERGTDNELQLKHGASYFASDSIREKYPAFVLFPQCPSGKSWHNGSYKMSTWGRYYSFPKEKLENEQLNSVEYIITGIRNKYSIDSRRIYIGGLSMGAMGTYEIVRHNPDLFAAAIAICGGANPQIAENLKGPDWWIFHGDEDNVVRVELSITMYEAIKQVNSDVRISIYKGVKHDSWTNAFAEPGLMGWLFSKRKD